MKTDDLIDFLARGVEPEKRPAFGRNLAMALAGALIIAVALVGVMLGFRPDLGVALMPVLMKSGFSALAAATALPLALRLLKPGAPLGWRVAAVLVFVGACALITCISLLGAPMEQRWKLWMGGSFPWCIVLVPLLAAPAAAVFIWLARTLAPTKLAATGAAIGAVAGGVGAMAYAMYCPVDSAAFVATWYAVAIGLTAAIGAIIGSIFLRW